MSHANREFPFALRAYGGRYEAEDGPHGIGPGFSGGFGTSYFSEENDLVVPLSSATAPAGSQALDDPCSHFDYFRVPEVQDEIRSLQSFV